MRLRKSHSPSRTPARRTTSRRADQQSNRTTEISNQYAFRRNRTLTGSSSASVASSNEVNAELRSPRAHVHHLSSLRRKLFLYFGFVALAVFALYMLVSQLVATTVLSVVDTNPILEESDSVAYSEAIESYYAARPVERFRFALNEEALLGHIQASRPEIKRVRVQPGSAPGEAMITITARNPIARWSIDSANQYVDGDGIVFAKNYFNDPELQIIDNSGLSASSSQLVASNRFLGFIGRVIAKSNSYGLNVDTVTIPSLTTRQVAVTLKGQTTEYKLSVDRSAGEQVEDISKITRYLAINKLQPGYVDVRIAGKAYYK